MGPIRTHRLNSHISSHAFSLSFRNTPLASIPSCTILVLTPAVSVPHRIVLHPLDLARSPVNANYSLICTLACFFCASFHSQLLSRFAPAKCQSIPMRSIHEQMSPQGSLICVDSHFLYARRLPAPLRLDFRTSFPSAGRRTEAPRTPVKF